MHIAFDRFLPVCYHSESYIIIYIMGMCYEHNKWRLYGNKYVLINRLVINDCLGSQNITMADGGLYIIAIGLIIGPEYICVQ